MKRKLLIVVAAIFILAWGAAIFLDWRPEQPPDRPPMVAAPEPGEAELEGFAKTTRNFQEGEDEVHLVLRRSHPLTVTVVGESGRPIPSARVYVARTGTAPWSAIEHTGPEGRARFAVPPGLLNVYVSSAGLAAKREGVREDQQKIEIRLRRTCDLRGTTIEEGSGDPVGGVTVRMGETEVTTGTDGRFLLAGVSPGAKLSFSSPWHISRTVSLSNVPADEVFKQKFTLTPAGRISGVVLTADGLPAVGAWVHTDWRIVGLAYRPGRKASGAVVLAGSDGKFSLDGVKPGEDFRVFAALSGSTAGVSLPLRLHAREALSEVMIRLGPPASAQMEVVTEDGTPLKEVSVEFRCMKGDPWAPLDRRSGANIFNFYRGPAKLTLEGLTGRPFKLYIHAAGYQPVMLPSTRVLPAAGLPVRKVRVILPRGLSISGFLLTASGQPVRGAVIHVNRGREHLRKAIPFSCLHTRTDEQGRFRLFGLEDTDYSIHALSSQGRTEVMEGVAAGSENIELRLK